MNLFDQFSFSTTWNGHRVSSGVQLVQEILSLGFHSIELNYKITDQMLRELEPFLSSGQLKVSSVHNVFPKDPRTEFDTDSLLLGYPDARMRAEAIALTRRSLDYAARLGAQVLVIHTGGVPVSPADRFDRALKDLYNAGRRDTPEYAQLLERAMAHRDKRAARYLNTINDSLEEIAEYGMKKGYSVQLAMENRAILTDLPDCAEVAASFRRLADLPVGFWLDTGHHMVMRNMGYPADRLDLSLVANRLVGMHIHDVLDVQDHWAPYILSDQLDAYLPLIQKAPLKVLELNGRNTPKQIMDGTRRLALKLQELELNPA